MPKKAGWYLGYMNNTNQQNTNSPFDEIYNHAVFFAKREMHTKGVLFPTCLLLTKHGVRGFSVKFPDNDQDKTRFTKIAKLMAVAHDAMAIATVAESWCAITPMLLIPPSESPDRIECVSVRVESMEKSKIEFLKTQRNGNGDFICLEPIENFPFGPIEGRFSEIMPAHPPTGNQRKKAEYLLRMMGAWQNKPMSK